MMCVWIMGRFVPSVHGEPIDSLMFYFQPFCLDINKSKLAASPYRDCAYISEC